jgi:glycosyltransferase involved in cell wall biosynthesis
MKIAWFTPFSRASAVGEYSRRVTNRIAQFYEVDLWLSAIDDTEKTELQTVHYGQKPELLDRLGQYDLVIYNIDDHFPLYKEIFETSRRHKGVIVLHDIFLHHFFAGYYLDFRKDSISYLKKLEELHGPEARLAGESLVAAKRPALCESYEELLKYPLFEEAIVGADGVIVHSRQHASLVKEKWLGPVRALDLPCYEDDKQANFPHEPLTRSEHGDRRLLLVTVGNIARNSQVHKVIELLAADKDMARRVLYVVVGPYEEADEYLRELSELVEKRSLHSSVQLLGFQQDPIQRRYLAEADILISLGLPAVESASRSVIEQMLAGKPAIVFDSSFSKELPDQCVVRVPALDFRILTERLGMLVRSEALRLSIGASARALALERFSVATYVTDFGRFVEQVASWRPCLNLIDRASRNLGRMGIAPGMGVVDVVANEIYQMFGFSKDRS